ncbi:MAG: ABC transporter permease [Chitinivibrionales bacterium]|nr:ABC transporter permease [Chitinivibrionales bacterium]
MFNYTIRRMLNMVPLLIAMSFVTFMFIRMAPGDILAPYRANPQVSEQTIREMEQKFHFDKPALVQYLHWLKNLTRLDFGYSFSQKNAVSKVIGSRLLNTLYLALFSIIVTWLFAIPLGIYCAVNQYKWSDRLFSFVAYIGMSVPHFFLALLLLFAVSVIGELPLIGKLPIGGMKSAYYDDLSSVGKFFDILKHMIIPGIVLGTASIASLQRIMRGNMLEELRARYITTARAKGLPENRVVYLHALRNAINPLITIFGYEFSSLLSGAALTEIITSWPGLGSIMLDAVRTQDLFLVMGNMMMGGAMLIAGNLIADILLAWSDPRIQLS